MAAEKQFENKVKEFLKNEGCWFIKYWGGGGFTKAGIPDLLVCCNGYFLGVELKAPKGKASEIQIKTLEKITRANGLAMVLYPKDFEDFKIAIKAIKQGATPEQVLDVTPFIKEWWPLCR